MLKPLEARHMRRVPSLEPNRTTRKIHRGSTRNRDFAGYHVIRLSEGNNTSRNKGLDSLERARDYWQSFPAGGVVIMNDGAVVAEWGKTDSRVKISSVRKSLLSALFGIYVHEGHLNLESTLDDLGINDTADPLTPTEKTATVRMLLQVRSAIYHDYVGGRPGMLSGRPERHSHKPGTLWYYNSWDFNALGTIFEQVTRLGIGVAFEERIARPIGMQDFRAEDVYYLNGSESSHRQFHFRMTARDLAGPEWNAVSRRAAA